MDLTKRNYTSGETVITAENLNDIQDAVIYCLDKLGSLPNETPDTTPDPDTTPTSAARMVSVKLVASAWAGSKPTYSQVVTVDGVTKNSKVDLQPTPEQLAELYNAETSALTTKNVDGVVTVYAIGEKPYSDMTMQAIVTEVST